MDLSDHVWVAERRYQVLNSYLGVRTDHEPIIETMDLMLEPFGTDRDSPVRPRNQFSLADRRAGDERHHAYRDCRLLLRSSSWDEVLDRVLGEINRLAVDEADTFAVHAGVIRREDRVVAIPGESGTGKSTLVAACLQAGFEYVSDESLCVEFESHRVVPYPKPLSLSVWSRDRLGVGVDRFNGLPSHSKAVIRPNDLGAAVASGPLELTDVVLMAREEMKSSIAPVPASEVITVLLSHSFNHFKRPEDTFRLVAALAGNASGWRLTYSDPLEAAELLAERLG